MGVLVLDAMECCYSVQRYAATQGHIPARQDSQSSAFELEAPTFPQLSFKKEPELKFSTTLFRKRASRCKFLPSNFEYIQCAIMDAEIAESHKERNEEMPRCQYPEGQPPLLDFNSAILGGSPCVGGTRLTAEHVYTTCAGSDSDAHVRDWLKDRPDLTAKQIKQAIVFERNRRGI